MRERTIAQYLLVAASLIAAAIGTSATAQDATNANSTNTIYEGKPAAGKAIFNGPGGCISCHRVGAAGAFYGPNLTNVGSRISPAGFRIILNNPPEKVRPENRLYEVTLRNGKKIRGKLLNQDPYSVQMLDVDGNLVAYKRAQISTSEFTDPPPMPSFKGKLSNNEIADLVAYLSSLRTSDN